MARGRRVDRIFFELEMEVEGYQKSLNNAERSSKKFTDYIANHPVAAAGALGAALVGVGAKALAMAADLEHAMAKVATQLDGSPEQVAKFRDEILSLFSNLPIENINDLTNGLYELISAGVPADEAMAALRVSAQAAVGGMTTVGVAVDGVTTALNAWSNSGLTATQVADQFFTAAKLGKTTFDEISAGIGQVAGLASTFGIELDDVLANMTALTLGGIKTSEAFTSIRAALSNVLKPQAEFVKQFPEIAAEFNRTKLEADGLAKFLLDLSEATKGNKEAVVQMFGSVEAMNAVMALTANGGERLKGVMDAMKNSTGASDKAFKTMAETAKGANQIIKNELSAELTKLGTVTLPLVNLELQGMVGLLALLNGSIAKIEFDSAVATLNTLAATIDKVGDKTRVDSITRIHAALRSLLLGADPTLGLIPDKALGRLTTEQLKSMQAGLDALIKHGSLAGEKLETSRMNVAILGSRIRQRPLPGSNKVKNNDDGPDSTTTALTNEQRQKLKQLQEERSRMIEEAKDAIAQATTTLVDDLELQLTRLQQNVVEKFGSIAAAPKELVQQLEELKGRIANAKATEPLQEELEQLQRTAKDAQAAMKSGDVGPSQAALSALDRLIGKTRAQLATTKEGTKQHKELNELLAKELGLRKDLSGEIEKADSDDAVFGELRQRAHDIEDMAGNVLNLAKAFGVLDEATAAALQNIVQIGANLKGAKKGDILAIANVAGGLVGFASGLFGKSQKEKERSQKATDNRTSVAGLARTRGEFGLDITGQQFAGISEAVATHLRQNGNLNTITADLGRLGLTMDDLTHVAGELGIALTADKGSYQQFLDALKQAELTQFAETFQGQMQSLMAEFELFDISDPIAQLQKLSAVFADSSFGAPALRDALAGLDLTSPEGRRRAQEAVQALFRQMQAGTLAPGQLGGLSSQEFLDALLQIDRQLGAAEQSTGGQSQDYAVSRSITEITGSQLRSIGMTQIALQQEANAIASAARDYLQSLVLSTLHGGVQPPLMPADWSVAGRAGIVIEGDIIINLSGVAPEAARQVGGDIADGFVARLDREFGANCRRRRVTAGDTLTS